MDGLLQLRLIYPLCRLGSNSVCLWQWKKRENKLVFFSNDHKTSFWTLDISDWIPKIGTFTFDYRSTLTPFCKPFGRLCVVSDLICTDIFVQFCGTPLSLSLSFKSHVRVGSLVTGPSTTRGQGYFGLI